MSNRIWKERAGTTLIEMVVTFSLLSLFCVAMVYMVTVSLQVYETVSGRANAETVYETLMEKISGEISGCKTGVSESNAQTLCIMDRSGIKSGEEGNYLSYADGTCINFTNRQDSGMYIYVDDEKHVVLHYRPGVDKNRHYLKAVDWKFDSAVYHGYQVEKLHFSILPTGDANSKNTNVILIVMKLVNEQTGYVYENQRYVECYNYDSTMLTDQKFGYGAIKTDQALTDNPAG